MTLGALVAAMWASHFSLTLILISTTIDYTGMTSPLKLLAMSLYSSTMSLQPPPVSRSLSCLAHVKHCPSSPIIIDLYSKKKLNSEVSQYIIVVAWLPWTDVFRWPNMRSCSTMLCWWSCPLWSGACWWGTYRRYSLLIVSPPHSVIYYTPH